MRSLQQVVSMVKNWRKGAVDLLPSSGTYMHFHLECSNQFRSIAILDKSLQAALETTSLSAERRIRAGNAFVELLTNAVQHIDPSIDGSLVNVNIYVLTDTCVAVAVEQPGQGFDASGVTFKMPEAEAARHRGLAIVYESVDGLAHSDNGNVWLMVLREP